MAMNDQPFHEIPDGTMCDIEGEQVLKIGRNKVVGVASGLVATIARGSTFTHDGTGVAHVRPASP